MHHIAVFVSSTSEDLEAYRLACRDVILDMGWHPVMMEHFGADPEPILTACRRRLEQCDLVLLIQAFRRGWVPGTEQGGDGTTSVVAYEFKVAEELNKPVLVFLAEDTYGCASSSATTVAESA